MYNLYRKNRADCKECTEIIAVYGAGFVSAGLIARWDHIFLGICN